ncbi:hypothetical protein VP01_4294g2 [Puccinia sorghi]|uniref:Uncharacterized protein n=1 Tax=Puccinia sorghi TaxID=27349 RepID=A0A0L6UQ68_9BASI|nr:hypothetical protein VP01_4294g2 [Puccinia sorghi]
MQVTLQTFGNEFQEEMTQILEEKHCLKVSQRTLTCCKEDWGLIQLGSHQQFHHVIKTNHNYTQSLESLKRKPNTMKLSRHTNGLDS